MQLPHPFDRPNQVSAYEQLHNSDKKYIILKLPTGSGKSAIAAQNAVDGHRTLSLVQTKSLQSQYEGYEFKSITGKSDYECLQHGQQIKLFESDITTADLCVCPKSLKDICEAECPYPLARYEFVNAIAGTTNYKKFLLDRPLIQSTFNTQGFDAEYIFLDEAHELSDIVIDFSGLTLNWNSKKLLNYCEPIQISVDEIATEEALTYGVDEYPKPLAKAKALEIAYSWLKTLRDSLKFSPPIHPSKGGDIKLFKWWKNKLDQVDFVLAAMDIEPDCWFVHSDNKEMVIRPLTARFHFTRLFDKADKIVLMSATISHKNVTALGIDWNDCEFVDLPNPVKSQDRPVYLLKCPDITWKSSEGDRLEHAKIVSSEINKTPGHWVTLVHFPSKSKAWEWGNNIRTYTKRPVYIPETNISTIEAYDRWIEFKDSHRGAVCCAWQFWTGVDAGYVNTNIVVDMPYPNFGDPFSKARFEYDPGEALNRVAQLVEQAMGRNRRGHSSDYGPDAEKLNIICDSKKFRRLWKMFNNDFTRSIVE